MTLFPILLVVHVGLALALFLPSLLLPFLLRGRKRTGRHPGPILRVLLWLQGSGAVVIGLGLAASGLGLLAYLGFGLLGQPWLLLALSVYAANLALAFFVQRPNLRRLIAGRAPSGWEEQERWKVRARRHRYVSYLMAAAVGLIGFLMSTKPRLW